MIVRHYVMIARPDAAEALHAALVALAGAVRAVEGNLGVELLRDTAAPTRFVFLERWESAEAYAAGGKAIPKAMFAPVMAALAEPPASALLEPLLTA